ncbi:MAG: elongation factor 1-beta [Candidatus Bathyarchaeota archaeon]|nr:elongation factor 1-beta [Candidatus Bathyarchaeota archaeon]
MAHVVVSFKIFPTATDVDLRKLQEQIGKSLPQNARIYADYQTEPIAFGINALIIHVEIPEEETGVVNVVEENIERIPNVSRIQTIMVRRTR